MIAHNLVRWMGRLAGFPVACLKTWRHRFLSLPARLVHRGRGLRLRFPRGWRWQAAFLTLLTRLRAIALPLTT